MSHRGETVVAYPTAPDGAGGLSTPELVSRVAKESSRLMRDELRLAQAEIVRAGKRAGTGAGMVGGAGVLAWYAGAALVAAAILALAMVLSPWAAALVVGGGLLVIAAVAGLIGTKRIQRTIPQALPRETVESLRTDLRTVMEHAKR